MINDLKELEKFFKICRKHGVTNASFAGHSFVFGEPPAKNAGEEMTEEIPTDALTPEQLMFYAVEG